MSVGCVPMKQELQSVKQSRDGLHLEFSRGHPAPAESDRSRARAEAETRQEPTAPARREGGGTSIRAWTVGEDLSSGG